MRTLHDWHLAMAENLPGWLWRGGVCAVSSEMWICPDFNCPVHGERLRRELDDQYWHEGIEVELRPGSYDALVDAAFQVMGVALGEIKGGMGVKS